MPSTSSSPSAIIGLLVCVGDAFEVLHAEQLSATTGREDHGEGVAIGPNGSFAVAGWTRGALPGETFAGGDHDLFIVKYSAAYEKLWTVQRGSSYADKAMSIACNPTVGVATRTLPCSIPTS